MNSSTPTVTNPRPRPLSPHLQVYSWLITSTLSIFHRLTGVILSFGLIYLAAWLIIAAYYPDYYEEFTGFSATPFGMLVLAGFTVSLYYHFFNGIRHLFWDMGKGFELDNVRLSGWSVIIATIIFSAATFTIGLGYIKLW